MEIILVKLSDIDIDKPANCIIDTFRVWESERVEGSSTASQYN